MFRHTKFYLMIGLVVAACATTAISDSEPKPETIQAQVFGTTTMAGRNFGITIIIEGYSTPAEQKTLIDAFTKGGNEKLVDALSHMKSKGRIRLSSGGVGYQIAYIRSIETPNGRTIRLITDRPINIAEAMFSSRSADYDISLIELQLSNDKSKSTGNLVAGGRFRVDKKKQRIEFESYHATPWRLAGIMER
ncbi:MAG TPA: hypothetical protein VFW31_15055 [Candidatus Angelobacter sp.]|nr:hypothetical protein [Candidatus Angelobacter sp.]